MTKDRQKATGKRASRESIRKRWLKWIEGVLNDVTKWSDDEGWSIARGQKAIEEESLGTYSAPTVRIRMPGGDEIHVEPVAWELIGAHGRINIEAWPALNRVRLMRRGNDWQIITDSNVPIRQKWNRNTFVQLARDLTGK